MVTVILSAWPKTGACSRQGVRLIIPIAATAFDTGSRIKVAIWNAEQLELSERTAACSVSYDMRTKTEQVRCPDGKIYEKPEPEIFTFSVEDLGSTVEVESLTVDMGDRYRLSISGLNADGCNTTSATVNGRVIGRVMQIKGLEWRTTMLGCP